MPETPVETVNGIYKAFAKADIEGVLIRMSPDIVWNEADDFPYADGNPYRGPEAVLNGVFARCASEWDDFAVQIDEIIDAGSIIIATGRYTGVYKETGSPQSTQVAHIWRVTDGKATGFQQYANTLHVAQVIGKVRVE
jgi:uncharacterized protein